MKINISENKIEKLAIKWLDDNYGNLNVKKFMKYNHYMKNGEMIFNYDTETHNVFIVYSLIWSDLKHYFSMSYYKIQELTQKWVEDRFELFVTSTLTYPDFE